MKLRDIFNMLLLAAIWGSSYLFIRIVAPVIGVSLTMGTRVLIAALFLSVLSLVYGQFPSFKKYWWQYLLLGALNMVLPNLLVVFSVMQLNASMGSVLNATTPLFTLLIARIWLKEKLSVAKITGLLLGIAGIVILVGWNPVVVNGKAMIAVLASILASVSYGVANVFTRIKFTGSKPMQTASGQMMGAAALVLPFMFAGTNAQTFSLPVFTPLLILGIVCTALAFIIYFKLVSSMGSVNTSMVTILVPFFGILWSAVFLKEPVTIGLLIGLIFIITGLTLVIRSANHSARTVVKVPVIVSKTNDVSPLLTVITKKIL
ncbi:DMT family transporter [Lacibacter sp. H375]|uniref:DMT family transporter n=1 Tax=Lacibacter sp. H375 TaxID=3133424 RepID=UPI0030C5C881